MGKAIIGFLVGVAAAVILLVGSQLLIATSRHEPGPRQGRTFLDQFQEEEVLYYGVAGLVEAGLLHESVDVSERLLDRRTLVFSGDINSAMSERAMRYLLLLDKLAPGEPIDLYLKTLGGWEDDAMAICDTMQAIASPVNVHAMGDCDSAGAIILAGATGTRTMGADTLLMVHAVEYVGEAGHHGYATEGRQRIEAFWKRVANLPEDWYPVSVDVEYFVPAEKAVAYGLVDKVRPVKARP